jgi:cell division protein FtsB
VKKRKTIIKVPIAQFVAIIALTISVFLIVDFGRKAAASYRVQREADRLEQEVAAAQRYQSKLLAQRTYVASDLYVEEVARKDLKWTKPGETVVMVQPIPEDQYLINSAGGVAKKSTTPQTPRQAWQQLFFAESFSYNQTQ